MVPDALNTQFLDYYEEGGLPNELLGYLIF